MAPFLLKSCCLPLVEIMKQNVKYLKSILNILNTYEISRSSLGPIMTVELIISFIDAEIVDYLTLFRCFVQDITEPSILYLHFGIDEKELKAGTLNVIPVWWLLKIIYVSEPWPYETSQYNINLLKFNIFVISKYSNEEDLYMLRQAISIISGYLYLSSMFLQIYYLGSLP